LEEEERERREGVGMDGKRRGGMARGSECAEGVERIGKRGREGSTCIFVQGRPSS